MRPGRLAMRGALLALGLAGFMPPVAAAPGAKGRAPRPNILLVLADDLGFSDIGAYGGEIATPNFDRLAARGVRFTQFYNAARCCPSRASLLTGLHPHQAGIGHMTDERGQKLRDALGGPAYQDRITDSAVTIAEALRASGYRTYMAGKWHVGWRRGSWPVDRGFDRSYALLNGATNYWGTKVKGYNIPEPEPVLVDGDQPAEFSSGVEAFATDEFGERAARFVREHGRGAQPFFLYLAHVAPHWPLHARAADIAKYKGSYGVGWDELRARRHRRMIELGIVDARWPLAPRDGGAPAWDAVPLSERAAWDLRMSVYAAQAEGMDRATGKVLEALGEVGAADSTLVIFLSDNGASAERIDRGTIGAPPGPADSYLSYGLPWANASNTPLRSFKHWLNEGGISTPMIVSWPAAIGGGGRLVHEPGQITDVMATCLDAAGVRHPRIWRGKPAQPPEGRSLLPLVTGRKAVRARPLHDALFWEHEGNRAVRRGKWKLVSRFPEDRWELYDIEADRTEQNDLAPRQPAVVKDLSARFSAWAARVGVRPWAPAAEVAKEMKARRRALGIDDARGPL